MRSFAAALVLVLGLAPGPATYAAEPETAPQVEPEATPEPEAEPEAKPEAEPEAEPAAEPDAKPEAEPDAKPEAEPQAKPEAEPSGVPKDAATAAAKSADPKDDKGPLHPFGGTLLISNSVGMGTFGGGEFNHRPYWNLLISLQPKWTFHEELKLSLSARLDLSVDLVENADSASTRSNQLFVSDTRLKVAWADALTVKDAFLAWSTAFELFLPTSLLSDLTGKYLGLRLTVTTAFEPLEWLSFSHTLAATKNFNAFTTATLDQGDFDRPPIARAGDGADVAVGLTATGQGITEWGVANSLTLEFSFLERFSATVDWTLVHAFTYQRFAVDALSSPNAQASRGQSDTMIGSLEIGFEVLDYLSIGVGTLVEQTPKTLDNERFRFPFWDTTNGAANRQVFYVDLTGTL